MPNRSRDWLAQAERDLEQARDSRKEGRHEWSCFAAQQAAEKAVKALHYSHNQEVWGNVIRKLLEEFASVKIPVSHELLDRARVLDMYYISARYANGHSEGPPYEHFGNLQSEEAIKYAGEIIKFCSAEMA